MIWLAIELAAVLVFAYFMVCIVEMVTKKLTAYILVAICLLIYTALIMAFRPAEDKHDPDHHDHYKCK